MAGRIVNAALRLTAILVVLALLYLGVTFAQVWAASRRDDARAADAIVVLGAAQYDGRPSPVLQERLEHANDLWRAGVADYIVVTGGRRAGDRYTEATAGYNFLRRAGVPDEVILREAQGTSTWESLAATARFLRRRDLRAVVLVSDGYHAYRAGDIAKELGLDASVSPSNARGPLRELVKETVAVAIGRVVGYHHLVDLDHAVTQVRENEGNR